MPEPSADLVEWAPGDYPEVIDPETLLPTSWSEQPRRDDAGRDAQAALGFEADVPTPAEPTNSYVELLRQWAIWARDEPGRGRFGDGSGGAHVVAGTEQLSGPAFYTDLEIPTGTVLETRGHPVYVRGTLSGDGTIDASGDDASGATGGAASGSTSSWGKGGAGGNAGAPGNAGVDRANSLGGDGGDGGNEGGGGSAGGAAGDATAPTAALGGTDLWRILDQAVTGRTPDGTLITGGAGGGGGGGVTGGGGGAGADVLPLFVHTWAFEGTIDASGGDGDDASASNDGGGGGGGGAPVLLVLRRGDAELVGDVLTVTVAGTDYVSTLTVDGGSAGAGNGTGFAGADGDPGTAYILRG